MNRIQLISITFCFVFLGGCGTYNKVVYMQPQAERGWSDVYDAEQSYEYRCSNRYISINPVLVQSRILNQKILFIPLPNTSEQEYEVDISEPIEIPVYYYPYLDSNSCDLSHVSIRSSLIKGELNPIKVFKITGRKNPENIYCRYTFVPIEEIGDDFYLHISSKILNCPIEPLLFRRKDGTKHFNRPLF